MILYNKHITIYVVAIFKTTLFLPTTICMTFNNIWMSQDYTWPCYLAFKMIVNKDFVIRTQPVSCVHKQVRIIWTILLLNLDSSCTVVHVHNIYHYSPHPQECKVLFNFLETIPSSNSPCVYPYVWGPGRHKEDQCVKEGRDNTWDTDFFLSLLICFLFYAGLSCRLRCTCLVLWFHL